MKRFLIAIYVCLHSISLFAHHEFIAVESVQDSLQVQIDSSFVDQKSFDEANLEEYRQSDDFNYETAEKEPTWLERFWNWIKDIIIDVLSWLFDDIKPVVGFLGFVLRLLPWIILAIALFLIIKYFAGVRSRSAMKDADPSAINYSDDEELIKRTNLRALLKKALEDSDFRLAVRFSYLIILKRLSEQKMIEWQQEKTNEDYIRELKDKKIQTDFEESTYWYDFVWYGNFEINQTEFDKANTLFNRLIDGKLE